MKYGLHNKLINTLIMSIFLFNWIVKRQVNSTESHFIHIFIVNLLSSLFPLLHFPDSE